MRAVQTAAEDAAGPLLDHLTDMNNTPEPRMPRIENLINLMGVVSSPWTTSCAGISHASITCYGSRHF
jgi:hypothetical protein